MGISEEKNITNKPIRLNMEMNQDTLEKMLGMNLKGMYYAFKTSLETHRTESMTTDQFVRGWSRVNGTTAEIVR